MKEIPLTQGFVALVDDEDADAVGAFKWRVSRRKRKHGPDVFYAIRDMRVLRDGEWINSIQMLHRFLFDAPGGLDHADGDGLNCQRSNLRPATQSENMANQMVKRPGCSSRFKGVMFDKARGLWRATITFQGRSIYLGYFQDEEAAARAYDQAARQRFGVFARTNFPGGVTS